MIFLFIIKIEICKNEWKWWEMPFDDKVVKIVLK